MSDKAQLFFDLFESESQYPTLTGNTEILPVGHRYDYVSSSFLNGLVNFAGTPIAAFGIFLYHDIDGPSTKPVQYMNPAGSLIWQRTDEHLTRRQVFELLTESERLAHPELDKLDCNVMILFRSGEDIYWAFDFDQDVSDCSVGRFETAHTEQELIEIFRARAEQLAEAHQVKEVLEIPLSFFKGWITF